MLNGGAQSFNFHPSHHKIPHGHQTDVQFLELSIDDFVPRSRKLKEKDCRSADGGQKKLSAKQLEMLKLVKNLPDVRPGIPSKSADPENRFFAGPVHQIRHSSRCCTLMDVLQTLQTSIHHSNDYPMSEAKAIVQDVEFAVPSSNARTVDARDCGPILDQQKENSISTTCILPPSLRRPAEQGVGRTDWKDFPRKGDNAVTSVFIGSNDRNSSRPDIAPEASTHMRVSIDPKTLGDGMGTFTAGDTHDESSLQSMDGHDSVYLDFQERGLHQCRFSSGVVSVSRSGLVLITSPPPFLFEKERSAKVFLELTGQSENMSRVREKLPQKILSGNTNEPGEAGEFALHVSPSHDSTISLRPPGGYHRSVRSIETESLGNVFHGSPVIATQQNGPAQGDDIRSPGLSPRLADIAEEGIVPSTPTNAAQPAGHKECALLSVQLKDCVSIPCDTRAQVPALPAEDRIFWRGHGKINNYKDKLGILGYCNHGATRPPIQPRTLEFGRVDLDSIKREGQPPEDQSAPDATTRSNSANPGELMDTSIGQLRNEAELHLEDGSGQRRDSEVIDGGWMSGSFQRPQNLKRLCRAWEKKHAPKTQMEWMHPSHGEIGNELRTSRCERGRAQRKLIAKAFIDEEADVSPHEDGESSVSDDFEDLDDEFSESFIDTASTERINGSVEMINVYRKSLLTPSPQRGLGNQQTNRLAPVSYLTSCSTDESPAGTSLEVKMPRAIHSPSINPPSLLAHTETPDLRKSHRSVSTLGTTSSGSDRQECVAVVAVAETVKDQKKLDVRKRKLSFQSSPMLEEDPFQGVDLDALETGAAELSRLQNQSQTLSKFRQVNGVPHCRAGQSIASNSRAFLRCSTSQVSPDDELRFVPSFDLGLGK